MCAAASPSTRYCAESGLATRSWPAACWAAIAELVSEPAATAEMKRTSELLFEFIDDFASVMTTEYLVERDRWVASTAAARGEIVQADPQWLPVDLAAASATLSYPLDRSHIALVLTQAGDIGPAITTLQNTAAKVLARLECSATLLIPQGASTVWAWGSRPHSRAEMPAPGKSLNGRPFDIGLGGPATRHRRLPAKPRRSRPRGGTGPQAAPGIGWSHRPLPRRRACRPPR